MSSGIANLADSYPAVDATFSIGTAFGGNTVVCRAKVLTNSSLILLSLASSR
jgi:hypothetical protein